MASNEVEVKFKGDNDDLNRALDESQSSIDQWSGYIKGALVGIGAAIAVKEVIGFGSTLVGMFQDAQREEKKLETVIRATGEAAGFSSDQMLAMADKLEDATGSVDENVLAVIATFKNIRGDVFEQAALAAADMAEVLGGDVQGAAMQVAKALNDPIKGMNALARSGVTFTKAQEEAVAAMVKSGDMMGAQKMILAELSSEFGGAATNAMETWSGTMRRAEIRLTRIGEQVGEQLMPILESFAPVIDVMVGALEVLIDELSFTEESGKQFSESWGEFFVGALKTSAYVVADVMSFFEWAFVNFSKIIDRQVNMDILSMVTFVEELKHLFTEVAPAYLEWLGENWANILYDMVNIQVTVLGNMHKNFLDFFTFITNWLAGNEADFKFTALTEGFESSLSELPTIAERQLSDTEKGLKQYIGALDKELSNSFNNTQKKNRDFVDKMFAGRKEQKVDMTANVKPFEKEVDDAKKKAAKDKPVKVEKDKADAKPQEEKSNAGAIVDLLGLGSAIQSTAIANGANGLGGSGTNQMMDTFVFNGAQKAELSKTLKDAKDAEEKDRTFAMNSKDKGKVEEANKTNIVVKEQQEAVTTLKDIKDAIIKNHPDILKALATAGTLV